MEKLAEIAAEVELGGGARAGVAMAELIENAAAKMRICIGIFQRIIKPHVLRIATAGRAAGRAKHGKSVGRAQRVVLDDRIGQQRVMPFPTVKVPNAFELNPTKAGPLKSWPAREPSAPVV